jgi:hypothetical protein
MQKYTVFPIVFLVKVDTLFFAAGETAVRQLLAINRRFYQFPLRPHSDLHRSAPGRYNPPIDPVAVV